MTLAEYYLAYTALLAGGLGLIFYVFIHRPSRNDGAARQPSPPAE